MLAASSAAMQMQVNAHTDGPSLTRSASEAERGEVGRAGPAENGREDDKDDGEGDIDPNEFDLMLSRSLKSSGPVLESEPLEYSMLRGSRKMAIPRARSHASEHRHASEHTPLLPTEEEGVPKSTSTSKSPFLGGVSSAQFNLIFWQIMITHFIACFDGTLMASSHPAITSYFGASYMASWLSTAFLLTSTSCQPLVGRLSDTTGRKIPYLFATTAFLVGTIWCALAQSIISFIFARAVCGVGAGCMMTMGMIIISDLVPIEIRGYYQSIINLLFGIGSMLGAAMGGLMVDTLGWRMEFGIQVPVILVGLIVSVIALPSNVGLYDKEREGFWLAMRTFDFAGSLCMILSVTFLILGLTFGGNVLPWSHPFVVASLVIFSVFFPLFLYAEHRASRPIMPLHFITKPPHMNLLVSNLIAAFMVNAVLFNVPLFFQGVLLTSATTSGLRLIVISAVACMFGTPTGLLITYTRRLKWPVVGGSALILVGALLLSTMRRGWPTWAYLLCMAPSGAGQGLQFPGTFMAILAASEQRQQAVVTSTLSLWRSLGGVLGVAVSSLIVQNALVWYLDGFVQGPERDLVIERVRQSVEAIPTLEAPYLDQVVRSYEATMRLTFLCCAVIAAVSVVFTVPMKLPRLASKLL